jgi:hypothetical protein
VAVILYLFNETRQLEGLVRSALFHGLETLGRNGDSDLFAELGDEKSLVLEVDLAAALARRVEFGRARAVGIPASNAGSLACYVANSCHMSGNPSIRKTFSQICVLSANTILFRVRIGICEKSSVLL